MKANLALSRPPDGTLRLEINLCAMSPWVEIMHGFPLESSVFWSPADASLSLSLYIYIYINIYLSKSVGDAPENNVLHLARIN